MERGEFLKKIIILSLAVTVITSGCVVYERPRYYPAPRVVYVEPDVYYYNGGYYDAPPPYGKVIIVAPYRAYGPPPYARPFRDPYRR